MKQIISQMSFNVHEKSIIYSKNKILVAISGGQDSILLLFILVHLKKTLNFELEVLFCHHFLQKINFYSVHQLFNLNYLLKLPFYVGLGCTNLNSEEKARIWRRKIFCRISHFSQLAVISIGHTTNDQIETAMWHLLRGTSPSGIISLKQKTHLQNNSISSNNIFFIKKNNKRIKIENFRIKKFYKTKIWGRKINKYKLFFKIKTQKNTLLPNSLSNRPFFRYYWFYSKDLATLELNRPLIDFNRDDIAQLVNINKIPLLLDPTNQSLAFSRNKIRLICIPLLEYYLNNNSNFNIKKYLTLVENEQEFLRILILNFIKLYSNKPLEIKFIFKHEFFIQIKIINYIIQSYTNKHLPYLQTLYMVKNGSPGTRTRN